MRITADQKAEERYNRIYVNGLINDTNDDYKVTISLILITIVFVMKLNNIQPKRRFYGI